MSHWPQYTLIILWVIATFAAISQHNKPRVEKYNANTTLISIMILSTLLYFGGFWSGM